LAAAQETGLVKVINEAITSAEGETAPPRLVNSHSSTRQQLTLTLLFMNTFGVRRPWDLRAYSGDGLALLSGRKVAYGYAHTERFLAQLAQAGAAECLTDSLAFWTSRLWPTQVPMYYVDGHKKPVYSDSLVPRGLVGRLDKVLGCRALTLLMDAEGHPLLVLTARGDQHLTTGLPAVVDQYEQAHGQGSLAQIIVDREGMSGTFLKELSAERTVITLLRSDQYQGLDSFSQVGEFVPLELDSQGKVLREVAPAQFTLSVPDQPEETLLLSVALIRDWRQQVPVVPTVETHPRRWDADLDWDTQGQWLEGHFEATPAPVLPTQPKLVAVVCTARSLPPVELAAVYGRRWVAQENIIRDFLLPLGLDINHGYAKTPVENSEVAKRRAKLQNQLDTARHGADAQYRQLNDRLCTPEYDALDSSQWRSVVRREKDQIEPEIQRRFQLAQRTQRRADELWNKYERDCARQRQLLRDLETLDAQERTMYELDNAKDQIMSVLKLMLVNLVMWVRDNCFPSDYAHATTTRLLPFLRLPGRILTYDDRVLVTLRPFNDRALNRDLAEFCQRVNVAHLCLPSGKCLVFHMAESASATSNMPP
jgi:hypothetical protein